MILQILMVISDIYETTGLIYYRKKEYTKALDYQLKCYSLRKKLPVDDYFDDLNNIGKTHTRLNHYDSAFYYYNKAELIAELSGYKVNIAHININIGHAYLDQNQYKKAIERLKKGLSIAEKIKRKTMARHSSMLLCLTYESMHDEKNALKYLRNYISWKDSLFNKLSKREMANFDAKYRAKEKEQKILLLNKDKKLSLALLTQERLKQQRLWTIFGVVIPLIVIGMYLWHKYRGKIMIAHQDNIRLKAVIEAEQKERKRISQDLHDSLGQLISIAKFKASDIDPKEGSIEDHQNLMNIIDHTYHELHNISNNIMPATLIDEGLIAATNELIATISNNKNIFIVFEAPQTIENLDDSKAFALFRILQETLSNIIKHAEATEVVVKIIKNSHSLSLIVSDNGKGMDISKINDYAGMGWKNIYSRVATMLGEINVKSNPNLGTQITIDIGYES
jgi:two-component system, NarL family, sensor kinase